ncbi:MAG: hypothetical protein IJ903_03110 [Ruminococcus sp.]|nr:hypothetical protein [Ruminococcus sp.]
MKKLYETPEFDYTKVSFSSDVLGVSIDEHSSGGGTIIEPDPGMEGDGEDW